jgi:galactose mutarotase-like enzyme
MDAPHVLAAGALRAVVLPAQGMLCSSLTLAGVELLREVDGLDARAARGTPAGIPLLYPWANRLGRADFTVLGRRILLASDGPDAPGLLFDDSGLPLHGVPWSRLRWTVGAADATMLHARLAWDHPALLRVFPFPHDVTLAVRLDAAGIEFETTVHARSEPVPVAFGFHPYVGLGGSRRTWRLGLPPREALVLDARMLPTGARQAEGAEEAPLGDRAFDHGYALLAPSAVVTLRDDRLVLAFQLLQGFRALQVYAPAGSNFIAIEPMAALTNALVQRRELPLVPPGGDFHARWRLAVTPVVG